MMKMRLQLLVLSIIPVAMYFATAAALADGHRSRFSFASSYTGQASLAVTSSMIAAGGGAKRFAAMALMKTLAGDKTAVEIAKLQGQYGNDDVSSFLTVMDFLIGDAVRLTSEKHLALPGAAPLPSDGRALAGAMYGLGVTRGNFDVEYMLDGLVSHPIHQQIMDDIDVKYGRPADANYHKVLQTAMTDLKGAYGF